MFGIKSSIRQCSTMEFANKEEVYVENLMLALHVECFQYFLSQKSNVWSDIK